MNRCEIIKDPMVPPFCFLSVQSGGTMVTVPHAWRQPQHFSKTVFINTCMKFPYSLACLLWVIYRNFPFNSAKDEQTIPIWCLFSVHLVRHCGLHFLRQLYSLLAPGRKEVHLFQLTTPRPAWKCLLYQQGHCVEVSLVPVWIFCWFIAHPV